MSINTLLKPKNTELFPAGTLGYPIKRAPKPELYWSNMS